MIMQLPNPLSGRIRQPLITLSNIKSILYPHTVIEESERRRRKIGSLAGDLI
jgi:hypothetical protein